MEIYLDSQTRAHGGWKNSAATYESVGIGFSGGDQTLTNEGVIDAMSDYAIRGSRFAAAGIHRTINNYGTIIGYITGDAGDSTFNNYSFNSWNLRNYADTDGDGKRDTKAVAISDFGSGDDTFNNTATGALSLSAVSGELATDTTGEYVPVGALSSANNGIVHGQLLNLNTFNNAGTIDLAGNGQAGDVLVITGGTTAGANGGGTYTSNGGALRLNTRLNQGDTQSLSDILVVDDVAMGTAATRIYIAPTID